MILNYIFQLSGLHCREHHYLSAQLLSIAKAGCARNPEDAPAWLSLIFSGRPWPACEVR